MHKFKNKKSYTEFEDIHIFPLTNIEHLEDNHFSNNISTNFDEINSNVIETNQLYRNSIETTGNNKLNDCFSHSSYRGIYNSLFNNMKNNDKISNLIVGLLLELKDVIHSKNVKRLIIENLSKRIDNYHNLFTNLKNKKITNLNKLQKITHKESKKKKNVYL